MSDKNFQKLLINIPNVQKAVSQFRMRMKIFNFQ